MSERKRLGIIEYISDDDCGMYRIGEIDMLPDHMVTEHINHFGEFGYEQIRDFAIRMLACNERVIREVRHKNSSPCYASEAKQP